MSSLRNDQIRILIQEGAFRGLETLKERGNITPKQERAVINGAYKAVLREVAEATKELAHIQRALACLAASVHHAQRSPAGPATKHLYIQMTDHLITFDAWVVSLLETDLTIYGLFLPVHTQNKITLLANAMHDLMNKRIAQENPVFDDPSLFQDYVDR